jgi:putative addiction module killer protein
MLLVAMGRDVARVEGHELSRFFRSSEESERLYAAEYTMGFLFARCAAALIADAAVREVVNVSIMSLVAYEGQKGIRNDRIARRIVCGAFANLTKGSDAPAQAYLKLLRSEYDTKKFFNPEAEELHRLELLGRWEQLSERIERIRAACKDLVNSVMPGADSSAIIDVDTLRQKLFKGVGVAAGSASGGGTGGRGGSGSEILYSRITELYRAGHKCFDSAGSPVWRAKEAELAVALRQQGDGLDPDECRRRTNALLEIRMRYPISVAQILQAITEGGSVEEIGKCARSLHFEVAAEDEENPSSSRSDTGAVADTRYEFMVVKQVRGQRSQFTDWLQQLARPSANAVRGALERVTESSVKKLKPLQSHVGLFEVRIHQGPGLRVYIGQLKAGSYVILRGGKKDDQFFDIFRAGRTFEDLNSDASAWQLVPLK